MARLAARHELALTELHPDLRARVERVLERMGGKVLCFDGHRPFAEQAALYAQGRTKRGAVVTGAEPGESPHNWTPALAVDFVLHPVNVQVRAHPQDPSLPDLWDDRSAGAVRAWRELGAACRAEGLVWGGNFKMVDKPHAELLAWEEYRPDDWRDVVAAAGFARPE
jgi:peptidoglycan L-alanyl-D-glutamate endopeptidase CwlK